MDKSYILLYHGVTKSKSIGIENFSKKHIDEAAFEHQMKWISENKNVVSMRNIKDEPNSVAVTFDDTFKNIHDVALPILKKYNIPATFFITTSFIDSEKIFWVDQLEHMINFSIKDEIELDDKLFRIMDKNSKVVALTEIKSNLKNANPFHRDLCLRKIKEQTGWNDNVIIDNYKMLSSTDVKNLDDYPMYEVGGHTENHEILSYLSSERLQYEVSTCISKLEKIIDRKVDLFSYPEGQDVHYNKDVIDCLKDNGITICPSAIDGYLDDADEFNYKRIMVGFMGRGFPYV